MEWSKIFCKVSGEESFSSKTTGSECSWHWVVLSTENITKYFSKRIALLLLLLLGLLLLKLSEKITHICHLWTHLTKNKLKGIHVTWLLILSWLLEGFTPCLLKYELLGLGLLTWNGPTLVIWATESVVDVVNILARMENSRIFWCWMLLFLSLFFFHKLYCLRITKFAFNFI